MAERMLCPIDFTLFSHHAIQWAVALARSSGSTITALHVLSAPPAASGASGRVALDVTSEDMERLQARAFGALQEAGARSPEAIVVRGDPATEIVHTAAILPAKLIVMASHGRTGFANMMCGSVTTNVLRQAPCPVLTVPRTSSTPEEPTPFRRILSAVDFSPASLHALRRAVALASATHSSLVVLHVVDAKGTPEVVTDIAAAPDSAGDVRAAVGWRHRLREAADAEGPLSVGMTEHVSEGDPADEILRVAEAEGCDLIAIGAHRGNPLNCTLNKVVRRSPCPVLTVRS